MSHPSRRAAGLAYREAGPPDGPPVLCLHGYPASSFMWVALLEALADRGLRGIAPDLAGYGDSAPVADGPATWERHTEMIEAFRSELALDSCGLVVHDWGVMIGLRWACDHPGAARALVISDGGFFADRRWHDFAHTLRTPDAGERLLAGFDRASFGALMSSLSTGIDDRGIDEYWKGFAGAQRRRGHLELYRSGDFEKLAPYAGRLAALGLPALVLWGARDRFASVAMAERFHRELPGSELTVVEDAGHFVWEDAPQATAEPTADFLGRALA